MRSEMPGGAVLAAEVTNISPHGFRILVDERDHWPGLDVDLTLESILQPERFPLVARE